MNIKGLQHCALPRIIRGPRLEEPIERVISAELEQILLGHAGEWAAIKRTELIAFGNDFDTVLVEARSMGILNPIMWSVPQAGTSFFL